VKPSDEIKSRLDIVDVIRDYIQLKPAGVNFRAICPFHREKSPSFVVSPEKQIWHCFGCGKGGDVISFVKEIEGLSFVEALRTLAPRAGVILKKENPALTSQRNRLLDAMSLAVEYYHRMLLDSPLAEEARDYLVKRGLTEKTIEDWQIGFSPDSWDDLMNLLKQKNFKENEIFLAGLAIKKENSNRFYNRFRNRLMFPINDANADPVAFTARVLPSREAEEKMGKYINSPQTQLYDKSKILFGLDKAKMTIKAEDLAILVEGQMDVITAHQHGYKNVVASSGTALTQEQLLLLKRYSQNIALAFDMDSAGQMAADRGIREAMNQEMNIKVIEVPDGKDPDECIKNNPKTWEEAVQKAKPMMQYFFDKVLTGLKLDKVEDKRLAAKKLLPIIAKIENIIEKEHWLKELGTKINVGENYLREALSVTKATESRNYNQPKPLPQAPIREVKTRAEILTESLLALLLKFPIYLNYTADHLPLERVEGDANMAVYKNLLIYYNNLNSNGADLASFFDYFNFRAWLEEQAGALETEEASPLLLALDRLAILSDRDYYNLDTESAKAELLKIVIPLKKNFLSRALQETERALAQAEQERDQEKIKLLMLDLKAISEEMKTTS